MTDLEALQAQENNLREQLKKNLDRQSEIILAEYTKETGLSVGSRVLYKEKKAIIKIIRATPGCFRPVKVYIVYIKKNGFPHINATEAYRSEELIKDESTQ